jgi:predicted Zn-dependent protease
MQQGEYEADELGFILASAAGYAPRRQLAFLERECRGGDDATLLATHPPACLRLKALRARLPLALRQVPVTTQ